MLLEKLKITDTLKIWRDKINAILDGVEHAITSWPDGHVIFGEESSTVDVIVNVPMYINDELHIGNVIIDPDTGTITGSASEAEKLKNPRTINGTEFDGTKNITTSSWGTARNFSITDGVNTSSPVSVNGSSNIVINLPKTIKANISGIADSANKLSTPRTINGTEFDGTKNITTSSWGSSRYVNITDASKKNTSTKVVVNGSSDVSLVLPSIIAADIEGNSTTATKASALITPRRINNVEFDGTKDITIQDNTKLPLTGGNINGNLVISGSLNSNAFNTTSIELSHTTPYIDFHFNKSSLDYTSRIIESSSGTLNINGVNLSGNSITCSGTITGGKVYNAVFNDYAEFFERGEETEVGDIIALDDTSEKEQYVKATENSSCVVGVHSNTYGHIIGGTEENEEDNIKNFIPVGLAGRVYVKFIGDGKRGTKIVPSSIAGVGRAWNEKDTRDKIVGYLLEDCSNNNEIKLVKMRIL